MFHHTHEWHFDGGTARTSGDKGIRTGFWHRVEWPSPGGIMGQFNHVVEILGIIQDEDMKMQAEKIR